MARKKKLDQLTLDVLEAEKAGMSYGKWKALQPPRKRVDGPVTGLVYKCCKTCGKEIPPNSPRTKFCSDECLHRYNYKLGRPAVPVKKTYEEVIAKNPELAAVFVDV